MAFDAHQGRNVRSASVGEFVYLDKRFGREAAKIPERIRIPPFDTYRILPQVGNDIDERCFLHHEINGTTAGQRRDIGAVDRNRKHINLRFVDDSRFLNRISTSLEAVSPAGITASGSGIS